MTTDLLPCPFCGGTSLDTCDDERGAFVVCLPCEVAGPLAVDLDYEDENAMADGARELWNRRAGSQP